MLATFVRDATTFTALPWQQESLGLSVTQVQTLQGIAARHQTSVGELLAELRMLFETVGMLDRPVDAHEAFALFYDIAEHKAEAMLDVLTPAQRAQWEAELTAADQEQYGL